MIISKLMGGLGNQMFQYAFGRQLALQHDTELKLDTEFLLDRKPRKGITVFRDFDLDIFNIKSSIATKPEIAKLSKRSASPLADKVLNKMLGLKSAYVREPHFQFSETAFNAPDNVYLEGYWQTEKYFLPHEKNIRSEFTFREEHSPAVLSLLDQVRNTNSVCVNVRRGDFVINPFHGTCGVDYYQRGEEIIQKQIADRRYFVFSDDLDWCEANLRFNDPAVFVSHQYAGKKFGDYLRIMSSCKHFIIPNSSFGWWAAWLNNTTEKIVVAPKNWFADRTIDTADLIPSTWIRS